MTWADAIFAYLIFGVGAGAAQLANDYRNGEFDPRQTSEVFMAIGVLVAASIGWPHLLWWICRRGRNG